MGYVYHGSATSNLNKIIPHTSTHGNFVYATPRKELAIIFAKRAGDDMTFSLFRNSKEEPYNLVERIPYAFEAMFSNKASIYTLDDSTFIDINTGFTEVVSETEVDVIKEEKIDNLYKKIKELETNGVIKIYYYPNKPNSIPLDNSDLIDKEIKIAKMMNFKPNFERLLFLHPQLLDKVNEKIIANNIDCITYKKEDLVTIFNKYLLRQLANPDSEYFLKSSYKSIYNAYPELILLLEEKIKSIDELNIK